MAASTPKTWKAPCRWLHFAWIGGLAVVTAGWAGYRELSAAREEQAGRLDAVDRRVHALEETSRQTSRDLATVGDSVAELRGETRAVLRTAQDTLAEVRELRKERR